MQARSLMTRTILAAALVALMGTPSFAQEPSTTKEFQIGEVNLGLFTTNEDTLSSKFLEYRDIPNGVTAPFFRILGDKKGVRYELVGENVQQKDQRYRFGLDGGSIRIDGDYNKIPHRFGNYGLTLLQPTADGVLELSDTVQSSFQNAIASQFGVSPAGVNYNFLSALVAPSLEAGNRVDLSLVRARSNLDVRLTPDKALDVHVTYFHENRFGDRAAAGTSFGFNNVVETPEPVGYITQDIGATAELAKSWGLLRGALHYNWFDNNIQSLAFDNPFRVVDSTDPSAYTSPGSGSINGPAVGLMSLPPGNNAVNGSVGTTLHFPAATRLTADFTFGRWIQNESPFIPYTTNRAITSPLVASNISTLPAQELDGHINVSSQTIALTSRPADRFSVRARFRRYDLDNKTARIQFPGYVRFDAVWEGIPRISVPYGYTTNRFDLSASYDVGPVTFEGGYKFQGFDRTFRETEKTTENGWNVAAHVRRGWVLARATYERASRDFDEYDFERSEDASFVSPGPPAQLPQLRRFDQAARDVDRVGAQLQLTPGGNVTVAVAYLYNKDNYPDTSYGLIDSKWGTFSADIDYTPGDRWSVFGFYSREDVSNFQRGRQSGATPSTNPLDDWTADVQDKVDSFGAGGTVSLVPEKVDLHFNGRYQKVNGNNDLSSPPGGTPDVAFGIANYDDTRLWTVLAEVEYKFAARWAIAVGGWFEDYTVQDAATGGSLNYYPGSFFLIANDGSYKAKVGYVRMTYRW